MNKLEEENQLDELERANPKSIKFTGKDHA